MIAHLVLFKLKPCVSGDDPRLSAVAKRMAQLPERIPGIVAWEQGGNMTLDAQAYDYGLRAVFANEGDLHAYFDHPEHLPVLAQWEEIAELAFCDFELT